MNKVQWAVTIALVPIALSVPAFAQPETAAPTVPGVTTDTSQQRSPATTASPSAVTTSNAGSKTAAALVKGANSFTTGEARRRIEAGVSQVIGLKKNSDGVWRGQAMRGGTSVSVFCDHQGNVGAP